MKKILLLLSFFVMACSFQAVAQKAQAKSASERAVMRAANKMTPQQELTKMEQKLTTYKKLLNDPAYATEQKKIQHNIKAVEQRVTVLRKKLNQ